VNRKEQNLGDEFRTLDGTAGAETKVQGSRFIERVLPVETKEAAERTVAALRKEFHDATHHCYAYRIGTRGDQFRYNDDGEPSGTAGKPILAAIDKLGLTNVLLVVIRYFGGTKLGTGGLARAYAEAAEAALGRAKVVIQYETESLIAAFPHSQTGNVMHVVSKLAVQIVEKQYVESVGTPFPKVPFGSGEVHLTLLVRKSSVAALKEDLLAATSGNIRVT